VHGFHMSSDLLFSIHGGKAAGIYCQEDSWLTNGKINRLLQNYFDLVQQRESIA
jgi:hypothetical protein